MLHSDLRHTAFFKFSVIDDPAAVAQQLRAITTDLLGSILVAQEGINGVLVGSVSAIAQVEHALQHDSVLGGLFAGMQFKHSSCQTPPFARMKVHVKPQVVAVGLPGEQLQVKAGVQVDPATLLSPQAWRHLIAQHDVVVLDNRNSFEFRLGHFQGAVDPGVSHFKDFPRYVLDHAEVWKAQGKRVAMYCTGGIRCEKTGSWMQGLGLDVFQLEGGILNYFQTLEDAERDWVGECFVFDNRIALDTRLHETATTVEQVYHGLSDGEWRLARARRLEAATAADTPPP